jgi:hypothetical protein
MTTSEKSGDVTVERHQVPAVPVADRDPIDQWDTYAEIRCGGTHAKVERFSYWHPNDARDYTEVVFDSKINTDADNGSGVADVCSEDPRALFDLAQVIKETAFILDEAQCTRGVVR